MKFIIRQPSHFSISQTITFLLTHILTCSAHLASSGEALSDIKPSASPLEQGHIHQDSLSLGDVKNLLLNKHRIKGDDIDLQGEDGSGSESHRPKELSRKHQRIVASLIPVAVEDLGPKRGLEYLTRWSSRQNGWRGRALGDKRWAGISSWGKRDSQDRDEFLARFGAQINSDVDTDSPLHKKWNEMAVWGKLGIPKDFEKKWNEMAVWGKREGSGDLEKKWNEMAVWGKRGDGLHEKKWNEMAVWGKRGHFEPQKKWNEMAVWGKRNAEMPEKKWDDMAVWGKRNAELPEKRWGEMAVWGKRGQLEPEKKWNEMAVWGKRNAEVPDKKWGEMAVWGKRHSGELEKKWQEMAVWGKRDLPESMKRWGEMAVWGKRSPLSTSGMDKQLKDTTVIDKELIKKWKDLAVWGKRNHVVNGESPSSTSFKSFPEEITTSKRSHTPVRKWRPRELWGKRPSWSRTGFTSWGKRSADASTNLESKHERFQRRLHELRNYLLSQDSGVTRTGFPINKDVAGEKETESNIHAPSVYNVF